MNDAEIIDLIRGALHAVAPKRKADFASIEAGTTIDALGLDSIATMEMVGQLEEKVDMAFADEDLAKVQSIGDLMRLVSRAKA